MDTHYLQDVFCLIIFAATYVSFLGYSEANEECYPYISWRWNDGIENNSLTNSWCIQYCNQKNNGYNYAGTKENECYCRKDAPISTFKVDFAFCNYICSCKSSTYCGGSHFSTYVTISLIDSNESGYRKRIIFSSDEATPECDWKRAGYEQRCNRLKGREKVLKKKR
ncbi:unnamed protein product [Mytilus edulis]|uniref:WSC domain-containing protein n=1 Tax=Mytilus edulis TaxID=6550 RepID=A0A8S3RC47_MYTED|nr:unnamed protein product [Mytilus edulis]